MAERAAGGCYFEGSIKDRCLLHEDQLCHLLITHRNWQIRNWNYFTWLSGDHVEQHVHNLDVMN